jgi:hypothetical protein
LAGTLQLLFPSIHVEVTMAAVASFPVRLRATKSARMPRMRCRPDCPLRNMDAEHRQYRRRRLVQPSRPVLRSVVLPTLTSPGLFIPWRARNHGDWRSNIEFLSRQPGLRLDGCIRCSIGSPKWCEGRPLPLVRTAVRRQGISAPGCTEPRPLCWPSAEHEAAPRPRAARAPPGWRPSRPS